jgi:hypothetical protein
MNFSEVNPDGPAHPYGEYEGIGLERGKGTKCPQGRNFERLKCVL